MRNEQKRYIIRKFVLASSLAEAVRLGESGGVDEVFLDPNFTPPQKKNPIGF